MSRIHTYTYIQENDAVYTASRGDRFANESSSADNNYFRHFLAFHAASPSIRKSYKPTVTFTPKFKTGKGWGENGRRGGEWFGPRPRVSPCLVKYHLIPREIRFNFTRHNTPAAFPLVFHRFPRYVFANDRNYICKGCRSSKGPIRRSSYTDYIYIGRLSTI